LLGAILKTQMHRCGWAAGRQACVGPQTIWFIQPEHFGTGRHPGISGGDGVEVVCKTDLRDLVTAAKSADVVIFFTSVMEGEVAYRMNLCLAPRQEKYLAALTTTGTPVVVKVSPLRN
jgi:hypothetical protein